MKKNKKRLKSFSSFFLFFRLFFFIFFITCLSLSLIFLPKPPPSPKKVQAVVGDLNISASGGTSIQNVRKLGVGGTITNDSTAALYVNGNVGIGTTGPGAKLAISGNPYLYLFNNTNSLLFDNPAYGNVRISGGTDPNGNSTDVNFGVGQIYLSGDSAQGIRFLTSPSTTAGSARTWTERMTIRNNGNVGIGTTSPGQLLSVSGNPARFLLASGATDGATIILDDTGGTVTGQWAIKNRNSDGRLGFSRSDGSGTDLVSITTTGNVGIGTTAPSGQLDVSSSFYTGTGQIVLRAQDGVNEGSQINFTGAGTNRYFYLDNFAGRFRFVSQDATGDSEKFTITNVGNVGIGTMGPTTILDVADGALVVRPSTFGAYRTTAGQIAVAGSGSGLFFAKRTLTSWTSAAGNEYAWYNPDGTARLWTPTADLITVTSTGNVGIGTTNPASLLHVYSTAGSISIQRNNAACGASLNLYNTDLATDGWTIKNSLSACGNLGDLYFIEDGTNGNERLTLKAGGNVGIGTTAAGSRLDIKQPGATDDNIRLVDDNTANYWGMSFNNSTLTYRYSGTDQIGIKSDGNVGIGTTAPGKKLDVNGTIRNSNGHIVTNNPNGALVLSSGPPDANNSAGIWFRKTATLGDETGSYTDLGRITDQGYLGIGTTSPGYQVDAWNTAVRGYGAYVNRASHSSLKDRYKDVLVLDKIAKLNIKEWQYKDEVAKKNNDKGRHLYPFADDFYKIFKLGDSEYQIRSEDIAGVALKGVQELNSFLNLDSISNLNIAQTQNGDYQVQNSQTGDIITRLSAFAETVIGKIRAGLIETKKLIVDGVDILKKLNELSAKVESQQKEIEGLKEEIKKLKNKD